MPAGRVTQLQVSADLSLWLCNKIHVYEQPVDQLFDAVQGAAVARDSGSSTRSMPSLATGSVERIWY